MGRGGSRGHLVEDVGTSPEEGLLTFFFIFGLEPPLQGYVYSFHLNNIEQPYSAEEFSRVQTPRAASEFAAIEFPLEAYN